MGVESKQHLSHSDCLTVQCLLKRFKQLHNKFREYHYAVVDETEQQDSLKEEQAIIDDQEDNNTKLVEPIQELDVEPVDTRCQAISSLCIGGSATWRVTST